MITEHLTKGSVCPPLTPGLLRCYSMNFCPYAQRTRLVLIAKNIKHEIVNIHLKEKPEWFIEKNPFQTVPTLECDGKLMCESLVTCYYLDEVYPNPPLQAKDPWQKGNDRVFMECCKKVSSPMYKVYTAHSKDDTEEKAKAFLEIQKELPIFESELNKRGTKFFGGDKPGMLDYMIWPFAERLPAVEMMVKEVLPQSRFSKIKSWMSDMKEDPVVQALYISPETHKKFMEGAFAGKPEYDMKV